LKRAVDITLAGAGLIAAAPLILLAALAIVLEDGLPAFFLQPRVGRGGRLFRIIKLRSMKANQAGAAITGSDDPRITRVGRMLRAYKLDELPQLWNVVKGEMSLVGPRPEVARFVDPSDSRWRAVLGVRPGITDPAALLYRDEERLLAGRKNCEEYYRRAILPRKLMLNITYIQSRSFWSDLKLLLATARASFLRTRF